jgi:hypothetical protein
VSGRRTPYRAPASPPHGAIAPQGDTRAKQDIISALKIIYPNMIVVVSPTILKHVPIKKQIIITVSIR